MEKSSNCSARKEQNGHNGEQLGSAHLLSPSLRVGIRTRMISSQRQEVPLNHFDEDK
jgi:hypothetical protein